MIRECPSCDASLLGMPCPACDPQPARRFGLARKILGAIGVAGWLAWTNVRERMPQRRAEDGRSWWHTVLILAVGCGLLFTVGLLVRCAEMQFSEYRATTTALDKAICERNALLSGEPADCGVAK